MRNSKVLAGLVAAAALVTLVACGNDDSATSDSTGDTSSASPTGTTPEDLRTSDAAVAEGMNAINQLAAEIAAAPAAQGQTLSDGIEPLWMPIEGTVQENSQETYDAYEGAFTLLESGDVTKARKARRQSTRRPPLTSRSSRASPGGLRSFAFNAGRGPARLTRVAAVPSPAGSVLPMTAAHRIAVSVGSPRQRQVSVKNTSGFNGLA